MITIRGCSVEDVAQQFEKIGLLVEYDISTNTVAINSRLGSVVAKVDIVCPVDLMDEFERPQKSDPDNIPTKKSKEA
jgi:hypothetical protein